MFKFIILTVVLLIQKLFAEMEVLTSLDSQHTDEEISNRFIRKFSDLNLTGQPSNIFISNSYVGFELNQIS